jgi:sulfonate transport system substrate-binding protein
VRVHPALPLLSAALVAFAVGCSRVNDDRPLRLGYFPNLTHGQAMVGVDDGSIAAALGGRLDPRMFNAGPAAMEALLAGELDASYVGPGPAVIAYLRSRGEGLRVVAGAASGGAVLVVRDAAKPQDLAGKRVASPQLGNTQDVALRVWLKARGLGDKGGPGGVEVTPLANPDILTMFARGDLAGAWVPEPWGARLVADAKGKILVDERTLWPDGKFPTTLLVVSRRALERRASDVQALLRAHIALTRRWADDRRAFGRLVNDGYGKRTGKPLPDAILEDALSRIEPTSDPLAPQLHEMARHAQSLGFAPPGDVSGMVDARLLSEIAQR